MKLRDNQLRTTIITIRDSIRYHRDQKGDDRCWLDDYIIWKLIDDISKEFPSPEEGMKKCRAFYKYRNSTTADKLKSNAILDPKNWDKDLIDKNDHQLATELKKLQEGIRRHRDIGARKSTLDDDRLLYSLLPENLPADFRLPTKEAFLGTANPNAGCPSFWKSHARCIGKHNPHQWGPCNKEANV